MLVSAGFALTLAWATGLHGGQEAENQPLPTPAELVQASFACSPPNPVTFLDFVPTSLAAALAVALPSSGNLPSPVHQ